MSKFFSKINLALATALGVGFIPAAPGTFGSAFALAVAVFIPAAIFATPWGLSALLLFALLTAFICGTAEKSLGHDAGSIVLDEVIGMWLALLWLPRVWWVWLIAFALFRLFDITKPLFVGKLQDVPGGWGVLLDDVAAGLLACGVTHGVLVVVRLLA